MVEEKQLENNEIQRNNLTDYIKDLIKKIGPQKTGKSITTHTQTGNQLTGTKNTSARLDKTVQKQLLKPMVHYPCP